MIPDYEYICLHFNASTEHEMSFEYDEELFELVERLTQDPRLPEHLRRKIRKRKLFARDLLRRAVRSYAYALRYPLHVEEPIWVMRSALYRTIKHFIAKDRFTMHRETARWRTAWASVLVDELYEVAKYMEKFSKGGNIQPLNYWGTGQSKKRYLPSKQTM